MSATANDFTDADVAALTDTVRRFATEQVRPHVDAWDAAGEFPRGLYRQAAELGLLGLGYPEHLGGTPVPWRARNALSQTLARHGTSGGVMASLFSLNIGLPPVLAHGSPELQAEVIPPALRGEQIQTANSGGTGQSVDRPSSGSRMIAETKEDAALFGRPGRTITVGRRMFTASRNPLRVASCSSNSPIAFCAP